MKVLLLTHGSRGDVQPFAALARALKVAGHEPILAAPASSAILAEPYGIEFASLTDTWITLSKDPVVRAAYETNFRGINGKRLTLEMMHKSRLMMRKVLDEIAALTDRKFDMVVHLPAIPGNEIAEYMGVPSVPACLQPAWAPTSAFPNPLFPIRSSRLLNRASYAITTLWIRGLIGNTTHWRREALALPNRRGHRNPLRQPDGSPATLLQAFSRHVLPSSVDYPDWVHTVGFWFLPSPPNWAPPKNLSDFLGAGEPPVYIGFGSIIGTDPQDAGNLIAEAIRLARVRAVVVTGWGGIETGEPASDQVLVLKDAPFDWLFPRMAAVVHHGGVGTIGAAMAAGRPQVVCPIVYEQPFYARRMHAAGVAGAPIPRLHLTPQNLAEAIRRAVTDRSLAKRAGELGQQVRAERGAETAVKVLETII